MASKSLPTQYKDLDTECSDMLEKQQAARVACTERNEKRDKR